MDRKVLILGARGRLGQALATAFVSAGWHVVAQVRAGAPIPARPGVQWLPVALDDTAALVRAASGASTVVHALNPPYQRWAREVLPLMDTAIRVSRLLGARLMFPGNVYNYGADMPVLLDEDTAMRPSTRKGLLRVQAEQRLAQSADVPAVVIRAGDYFGSGRGSWFDLALVKDIRAGKMTLPGTLDVATPWAYVPDLARVFVAVAERWQADPQCLPRFSTLCYPGHQLSGADWRALLTPIARQRGWLKPDGDLKVQALPWGFFQALSFAVPLFRELAEMKYLPRTPHALAGHRLSALVGDCSPTPLAQAVPAALEDLTSTQR